MLEGLLVTPQGVLRGRIEWTQGRIAALRADPVSAVKADALARGGLPWVLPGFIDLHVHGGGGRDLMEAGDAAATIARTHARHGTTAMLATTMTAPLVEIERALDALAPHLRTRGRGQSRWLGVHLEGPFLNPQRLGAQPDFTVPGTRAQVRALHARAAVRVVSLAPELDEHIALIRQLRDDGFRVQLGHSNASYEQGVAALAAGASGFTHLFNAMGPLHHRAPGLVGAALAHAEYAELIPDLLHLHAGTLRLALRAIPRCYCVSDATAATGMPDGEYALGRHRVFKCLGSVRLADDTLAGSCLTMDQALRHLVQQLDLSIEEAARRTATYAADYLGEPQRGRLAVGAWADLVVLDCELNLQRVVVEGEEIELADA